MRQGYLGFPLAAILGFMIAHHAEFNSGTMTKTDQIELGNFSVSLAVKDLQASKEFYEKLGFKVIGGSEEARYLILQNSTSTIGIFQGMFDKNILTFNPGWDRNAKAIPEFQDVREIQKKLVELGITPSVVADENSTGPASFMIADPDGNQILLDQHVPAPGQK